MATSLFRLGRLGPVKCLQLENWGILKSCPAASFSTKSKEPAKPVEKTKAAGKTAETPDERASLLAYKTAVAFPVRLSGSGLFPAQSASEPVVAIPEPVPDPDVAQAVGGAIPSIVASPSPARETPFEVHSKLSAPKDIPVAASSECGDAAVHGLLSSSSSSSSESDSDSDSDSDSEDEKSEMKTRTRRSAPVAEPQKVTVTEVKEGTNEGQNESGAPLTSGTETAASGAAQATVKAPSIGFEKSVNPFPKFCTTTENTRKLTSSEVSAKDAPEAIKDTTFRAAQVKAPAEAVGEALPSEETQPACAEAATVTGVKPAEAVAASVKLPTEDAPPAVVASEAAAEASVHAGSIEERVDPDPVVTEAAGEELQAEATPEHSEEAVAVAPPEPEELFDNSTYKNYQHHSYTPYTFADLDVEMAKFRLPQPSSGKPSPRH